MYGPRHLRIDAQQVNWILVMAKTRRCGRGVVVLHFNFAGLEDVRAV